jgi:hypothetical protein
MSFPICETCLHDTPEFDEEVIELVENHGAPMLCVICMKGITPSDVAKNLQEFNILHEEHDPCDCVGKPRHAHGQGHQSRYIVSAQEIRDDIAEWHIMEAVAREYPREGK